MKTNHSILAATMLLLCSCEKIYPELPQKEKACIDQSLIDKNKPVPAILEPVCGCDGNTYDNKYLASQWYGVTSFTTGACQQD